ncbi:hypothetical protein D5R40_26245 [Okeania hirsuta]|uniref:Calcium-binding protein n=2 Tax=Microcoleaceae TaxID=1892252 RepID=A0A3N6PD75_9CYAN|nr:hypothetical protein [Okeania sp. SIO2B9]RQH27985.1 hypothetical protein D5R40_26245 [Okeania hirsuta]
MPTKIIFEGEKNMAETVFNEQVSKVYFTGRYALRIMEQSNPHTMPDWQTNFSNNIHRHDPGNTIIHETRKEREALGLDYKNVHVKEFLSYSTINGNDRDNNITGAQPQSYTWYHGINNSKTSSRHWDGTFDDEINGGKGNDVIQGLNGNDTLRGEEDNDVLHGGNGRDNLEGGIGNDALHGGEGTDNLDGGIGYDLLYTGRLTNGQSDTLKGGANADTFFLGDATTPANNDPVTTGGGFNWKNLGLSLAGDVSDLLFTVIPGLGTVGKITKEIVPMLFDVTKATSNNVTAPVEKGASDADTGSATITDFNPTEDVIFIPLPSDGDIYIDQNNTGNNLLKVFQDTDKTDTIATVQLSNDFNNLEGNSNGKLQSNWFDILERNALILDSSGAKDYKSNTQLNIAPEDIENLGTNKFLVLGAYSGFDIKGSNNSDYSYGTQFGDVIYGYETPAAAYTADDDVLYGFKGDDQFLAGQGNDRIFGGDGSDSANYMDSTSGITINLENGGNNDDGFGTKDTLNSIENIIGSDHNDNITGDGQANIFISGKGDDNLTGNGGQDTFRLSSGKNTITDFTSSEDKIQIDVKEYYDSNSSVDFDATYSDTDNKLTISIAGQQAAILENISENQVADALKQIEFIGEENNTIVINNEETSSKIGDSAGSQYVYGHAGNDNIALFGGRDVVLGGDGGDSIITSQQGDTAIGGTGADTFSLNQYGTNFSPDRILDFTPAEGDKIEIWKKNLDAISDNSDPSLGLNFTHSETNNALTITLGDRDLAILENISKNQVGDALKQIEILGSQTDNDGSEGSDDVLIGNSGNQLMRGLGGNDYLYSGGGNDTLRGGWQDDLLLGGDGNDLLQGFEDSDVLIGGGGADIFAFIERFDAFSGVDKILDFTASEGDRIRINRFHYGFSSLSDLSFNEQGQLLANGDKVIAILENESGFNLNSHVDLVG